jgi:hypothetical protein
MKIPLPAQSKRLPGDQREPKYIKVFVDGGLGEEAFIKNPLLPNLHFQAKVAPRQSYLVEGELLSVLITWAGTFAIRGHPFPKNRVFEVDIRLLSARPCLNFYWVTGKAMLR